jgi:hypothetical protein
LKDRSGQWMGLEDIQNVGITAGQGSWGVSHVKNLLQLGRVVEGLGV